jgi:hypothetical protein
MVCLFLPSANFRSLLRAHHQYFSAKCQSALVLSENRCKICRRRTKYCTLAFKHEYMRRSTRLYMCVTVCVATPQIEHLACPDQEKGHATVLSSERVPDKRPLIVKFVVQRL